jgi:hypothetical protein
MTRTSAVAAVLFTAATALGVRALVNPSVANAAPKEWDIGTYDACVQRLQDDSGPSYGVLTFCCALSGGVWNDEKGNCEAPPATTVQRPSIPRVPPTAQTSAPLQPGSPR